MSSLPQNMFTYLRHDDFSSVPGPVLWYLVGWGQQDHHSCCHIYHCCWGLAKRLQLSQVSLGTHNVYNNHIIALDIIMVPVCTSNKKKYAQSCRSRHKKMHRKLVKLQSHETTQEQMRGWSILLADSVSFSYSGIEAEGG